MATWVQARIQALLEDSTEPDYLRHHCRQFNVLPLLIDWTAFAGLRPDGRLLWVDTEDGTGAQVIRDPLEIHVALFQGALRYDELRALLPKRGRGAIDCDDCAGTGSLAHLGGAFAHVVCRCGGAGWLPRPRAK